MYISGILWEFNGPAWHRIALIGLIDIWPGRVVHLVENIDGLLKLKCFYSFIDKFAYRVVAHVRNVNQDTFRTILTDY